jgi:hypothetical protein
MCICVGPDCASCSSAAVVGVCRDCADCEMYRVKGTDFRFMCIECISCEHHTLAHDNDWKRQEAIENTHGEPGLFV